MTSNTVLHSKISNTKLLELYGYEPWGKDITIQQRWEELAGNWAPTDSDEIGDMRQTMLQIHQELFPDDERWIR